MSIKWGTYPWFTENGIDLIHPDDLETLKRKRITVKCLLMV